MFGSFINILFQMYEVAIMQRGVLGGGAQAPVRPPPLIGFVSQLVYICHDIYYSIN